MGRSNFYGMDKFSRRDFLRNAAATATTLALSNQAAQAQSLSSINDFLHIEPGTGKERLGEFNLLADDIIEEADKFRKVRETPGGRRLASRIVGQGQTGRAEGYSLSLATAKVRMVASFSMFQAPGTTTSVLDIPKVTLRFTDGKMFELFLDEKTGDVVVFTVPEGGVVEYKGQSVNLDFRNRSPSDLQRELANRILRSVVKQLSSKG